MAVSRAPDPPANLEGVGARSRGVGVDLMWRWPRLGPAAWPSERAHREDRDAYPSRGVGQRADEARVERATRIHSVTQNTSAQSLASFSHAPALVPSAFRASRPRRRPSEPSQMGWRLMWEPPSQRAWHLEPTVTLRDKQVNSPQSLASEIPSDPR